MVVDQAHDGAGADPSGAVKRRWIHWRSGLTELVVLSVLYVGYSASRLLADQDLGPARVRAGHLLHIEAIFSLDWETTLNGWFVDSRALAVFGSYWYATTHYIVTVVVLVWLFLRGPRSYLPARRALVIATLLGLAAYLMLPTAPPRLYGGYTDILRLTSGSGWWGADASAPKGLGDLTNELAAFPSLHAGWALWVAIVVQTHSRWWWPKVLGWCYALTMAFVIVGTANHWVLDVVIGWVVVLAGFGIVRSLPALQGPRVRWPGRSWSTSAAVPHADNRSTGPD